MVVVSHVMDCSGIGYTYCLRYNLTIHCYCCATTARIEDVVFVRQSVGFYKNIVFSFIWF